MSNKKKVALLGTGIMGSGMGMNLLKAGHELVVWNRTEERTRILTENGAILGSSPAAAVEGVEFIITMLKDGNVVRTVLEGEDGALKGMSRDQVWIEMSTVGPEDTEAFASNAKELGVAFVDAPVLGTKAPAESGELVVVAGGDPALIERCRPVFEAVGRRTIEVGPGNMATRFKLVLNNWVVSLIGVIAETIAIAETLDIDPQHFLEAIKGGPLDVGYAHIKGGAMIKRDFPASFPLELSLKDTRLILSATHRKGQDLKILNAVSDLFAEAESQGYGREDLAAIYRAVKK
jgi:3-hydroxyisobutyrate dehydrogenase